MDELTRQDVDTLIEAIEAWERGDQAGELVGDMLGAMFCKGDPESMRKMEEEAKKRKVERDQRAKVKKERGVLLRAKLIRLRDSSDADALLEDATK